jgi:hypothetical protein
MATKTTGKKLTPTEKQMIEKAATKALKFTKQKLTPDVRDEIFKTVEQLKGGATPVVGKEAIALWAAKIDYAIANGDQPTVARLVTVPRGSGAVLPSRMMASAGFYDSNGGCSCGGGAGGAGSW